MVAMAEGDSLPRLTGFLGWVCGGCSAYNDPGTKSCAGCGKPFGEKAPPPAPSANPPPSASVAALVKASVGFNAPPAATPATQPAAAAQPPAAADPAPIPLVNRVPGRAPAHAAAAPAAAPLAPILPRVPATMPLAPAVSIPVLTPVAKPAASPTATATANPTATATANGASTDPVRATLVLLRGEGLEGASFKIQGDSTAAGRERGQVVFPNDPCLAPLHATFLYRGGALYLRDEGAPGGVYLRLRSLSVPLRPGDFFALGGRLLRFLGPPQPPAPLGTDGTARLGAPRPQGPAVRIEEWLEGGVPGRTYLRAGPSISLGRGGCAITLGGDQLDERHAEIVVDANGNAKLKDLGSTQGTFVRLASGTERELAQGDLIRLGREVLRVEEIA
jgi:pSer/pThr/pTyr-binding forkhead associated (FHA) protein